MKFTRPYIYCVIPLDKDTGDEQDVLFWIQDETTLQSHKSLAENMAYATGQPSRIVRFKRDDVLEEILKDGFITKRYVNPTTMIGVIPLLYGRARLGKGDPRNSWFDETWDYETVDEAVVAASQWNPETQDEPPGKFKDSR